MSAAKDIVVSAFDKAVFILVISVNKLQIATAQYPTAIKASEFFMLIKLITPPPYFMYLRQGTVYSKGTSIEIFCLEGLNEPPLSV
jgi:hypothetical protein